MPAIQAAHHLSQNPVGREGIVRDPLAGQIHEPLVAGSGYVRLQVPDLFHPVLEQGGLEFRARIPPGFFQFRQDVLDRRKPEVLIGIGVGFQGPQKAPVTDHPGNRSAAGLQYPLHHRVGLLVALRHDLENRFKRRARQDRGNVLIRLHDLTYCQPLEDVDLKLADMSRRVDPARCRARQRRGGDGAGAAHCRAHCR